MKNTALILIDIQNDYFPEGKMELIGMTQATENAKSILEYFRKENSPIFHIQHISTRPNAHFFIKGTIGAEIHESVKPKLNQKEKLIIKHYPNSFRETSLHEQLKELSIEKLIICGAMSHMCIDTTTRYAFDLGYSSIVIADACATKNLIFQNIEVPAAQVHAAYMAGLSGLFAEVVNLSHWQAQNKILS